MISPYKLAKALVEQHDFDYDIAFLSAWYLQHSEIPKASLHQIVARMALVKNVPTISKPEADYMLAAYSRHKIGQSQPTEGE